MRAPMVPAPRTATRRSGVIGYPKGVYQNRREIVGVDFKRTRRLLLATVPLAKEHANGAHQTVNPCADALKLLTYVIDALTKLIHPLTELIDPLAEHSVGGESLLPQSFDSFACFIRKTGNRFVGIAPEHLVLFAIFAALFGQTCSDVLDSVQPFFDRHLF